MKTALPNVTLVGIDCVDLARLQRVADICETGVSFGAVKLLSSLPSTDPRVTAIPPIKSTRQYSDFCVRHLAGHIGTEFALVFQYDGFILNPAAWSDEFLQYDYIGAPWGAYKTHRVGNGGFSLRSKRLLDFVARFYPALGNGRHPEDLWLARDARHALEQAGFRFAPEDVAARFSIEGLDGKVAWDSEFGFHSLIYTDISKWVAAHPEHAAQYGREPNDYLDLLNRYKSQNGTVHSLPFFPSEMASYARLAKREKHYDARRGMHLMPDPILEGHTVLFRRLDVPLSKIGIPAFARVVEKVEHFGSKAELFGKYPDMHITYEDDPPRWKRRLANMGRPSILGGPELYTVIWFNP